MSLSEFFQILLPYWGDVKSGVWASIISAAVIFAFTVRKWKPFLTSLKNALNYLRSIKSVPPPEKPLLIEWSSNSFSGQHLKDGVDSVISLSGWFWNFDPRPVTVTHVILNLTINEVRIGRVEKTIRDVVRYANREGVGINVDCRISASDASKILANRFYPNQLRIQVESGVVFRIGEKEQPIVWQQRELILPLRP